MKRTIILPINEGKAMASSATTPFELYFYGESVAFEFDLDAVNELRNNADTQTVNLASAVKIELITHRGTRQPLPDEVQARAWAKMTAKNGKTVISLAGRRYALSLDDLYQKLPSKEAALSQILQLCQPFDQSKLVKNSDGNTYSLAQLAAALLAA